MRHTIGSVPGHAASDEKRPERDPRVTSSADEEVEFARLMKDVLARKGRRQEEPAQMGATSWVLNNHDPAIVAWLTDGALANASTETSTTLRSAMNASPMKFAPIREQRAADDLLQALNAHLARAAAQRDEGPTAAVLPDDIDFVAAALAAPVRASAASPAASPTDTASQGRQEIDAKGKADVVDEGAEHDDGASTVDPRDPYTGVPSASPSVVPSPSSSLAMPSAAPEDTVSPVDAPLEYARAMLDDPAVHASLDAHNARLVVDGLLVQMVTRDGGTEVRVAGAGSEPILHRADDLREALRIEGIRLDALQPLGGAEGASLSTADHRDRRSTHAEEPEADAPSRSPRTGRAQESEARAEPGVHVRA